MHPLDLVKTRFQIQRGGPGSDPNHYSGLVDCFRKMFRQEGPLSFYKGILPPILAETPKRATKFFTFEQYKQLFNFGGGSPTPQVFILAGLCSGVTEGFVINPFEVIKVKLQAERGILSQQQSTMATAREIVRKGGLGLRGLNKGLTSTLGRHGVWNMVYFGFYHNVKASVPPQQDTRLDFARRFLIGLAGGTLASVANIPIDVAKSRIQGPQPGPTDHIKYRTCIATILTVYKEEGFLALYKGLLPKILRLGPGGAIMLIIYEHTYDLLKTNFA